MSQSAKQKYQPPPPSGASGGSAPGQKFCGAAVPQQAAPQAAVAPAPASAAGTATAVPGTDSDEDATPAFSIPNKDAIRSAAPTTNAQVCYGVRQKGRPIVSMGPRAPHICMHRHKGCYVNVGGPCCRRAKEKRERLRSAHLAPDYIPLGGAAALTSNQAAADKLRRDTTGAAAADGGAARASDSGGGSDSDEEEGEPGQDLRMQFGGGAAPQRQSGRRSKGSGSSDRAGGSGAVFASALHEVGPAQDGFSLRHTKHTQ